MSIFPIRKEVNFVNPNQPISSNKKIIENPIQMPLKFQLESSKLPIRNKVPTKPLETTPSIMLAVNVSIAYLTHTPTS